MILPAVALLLALAGEEMASAAAAAVEGRPAAGAVSPLQARVDAAPEGSVVEVGPGTYRGDLYLDRRITLSGRGRPRLQGSGAGSVVRVRAAGVVLEGFDIDGGGGGDLGRDSSGIHVAAKNVTIRDCRVSERALRRLPARGRRLGRRAHVDPRDPGQGPGREGLGHPRLEHRRVPPRRQHDRRRARRLLHPVVLARRHPRQHGPRPALRPPLHVLGRQRLRGQHLRERRRRARRSCTRSGSSSGATASSTTGASPRSGLLFKACDDVTAESNLIADNARGIFLEGSYRNLFRGNVVAESDIAIVLYDSCAENRFDDNLFVANMTPLTLVGRRTDTDFDGNYWSGNDEPDLDGDGRSDRPYRLSSVFDHFRGNLTAADLFTSSFAASAALGAPSGRSPCSSPSPSRTARRSPGLPPCPPSRGRPLPPAATTRAPSRPAPPRSSSERRGLGGPPMIRFRDFSKTFGTHRAVDGLTFVGRAGRGRRAARAQRLGQDDDAQGRRRTHPPDVRRGPRRRSGPLASGAGGAPRDLLPAAEGDLPGRRHRARDRRVLPAASATSIPSASTKSSASPR